MTSVAIVGDGQMGLVLADALITRGIEVHLWGPFPEVVVNLATTRKSPRLHDFQLADGVHVSPDASAVLQAADTLINAIPTQYVRKVWGSIEQFVPKGAPIASVAKGVEIGSLLRPTQVIQEVVGTTSEVCVLSGPTIATELAKHQPAAMVASSTDQSVASLIQDLFHVHWLRIYTHDDPLGVELAGATKNVIAIAAGICDGMGLGDNAKSAMLARGLAEISRLGVAMGANVQTFFGIAGVGDLATTCFSPHGRNRTCGERLGQGEDLETIQETMGSVIEGVPTTKAVRTLARNYDIEMPISESIYQVLFEGLPLRGAIESLMSRDLKAEKI
ncbi:MAG: NAD(P)H-dependent glycerol-3-phosphate dehydrogenase [Phycisphaerales bacterium]|jgi:glycerol-3-phosphate dehydrogenase (NAD(P)+)|nr:NAD(P)H-dependent glycerol-3-phosphate dehydrogenase [Phycisphaerales bacterium]